MIARQGLLGGGWGWAEQFAPSPKVVKEPPTLCSTPERGSVCKMRATQDSAVGPDPSILGSDPCQSGTSTG